MKKFNIKEFSGKQRVEKKVQGSSNITKIWNWNSDRKEYEVNRLSKSYMARRVRILDGIKTKQRQAFYDLEQAKAWQQESNVTITQPKEVPALNSPFFEKLVNDYRKHRLVQLKISTQNAYTRMLENNYFDFFKKNKVGEITAKMIDEWILILKSRSSKKSRIDFKKEFSLLKTILNYHAEDHDDYKLPFKPRHKKSIVLKAASGSKFKDLNEQDFLKFRNELLKLKLGRILYVLATVQYYQALRIGEVAAIHLEDLYLSTELIGSRLRISKSVMYGPDKKGVLQDSFKNSKSNSGVKESPLFSETHRVLINFINSSPGLKGILFINSDGSLLTYRQIQSGYDRAFKNAGLNYSGTHIMRHGGARRAYDASNGDIGMVKQLLGNSDLKSVMVYAQRSTEALNDFCRKEWDDIKKKEINSEVSDKAVPQKSTEL